MQWRIVVGNPNWKAWKRMPFTPDMSNVGSPIRSFPTYATRREAREAVRKILRNPFWFYRVEKVKP